MHSHTKHAFFVHLNVLPNTAQMSACLAAASAHFVQLLKPKITAELEKSEDLTRFKDLWPFVLEAFEKSITSQVHVCQNSARPSACGAHLKRHVIGNARNVHTESC